MAVNEYPKGNVVTLEADFTVDGVPTDPTSVTLRVKEPDGTITVWTVTPGQVVNDPAAVGAFYADWTIDQEGLHEYRFEGTGAAVAASPDRQFLGLASAF